MCVTHACVCRGHSNTLKRDGPCRGLYDGERLSRGAPGAGSAEGCPWPARPAPLGAEKHAGLFGAPLFLWRRKSPPRNGSAEILGGLERHTRAVISPTVTHGSRTSAQSPRPRRAQLEAFPCSGPRGAMERMRPVCGACHRAPVMDAGHRNTPGERKAAVCSTRRVIPSPGECRCGVTAIHQHARVHRTAECVSVCRRMVCIVCVRVFVLMFACEIYIHMQMACISVHVYRHVI